MTEHFCTFQRNDKKYSIRYLLTCSGFSFYSCQESHLVKLIKPASQEERRQKQRNVNSELRGEGYNVPGGVGNEVRCCKRRQEGAGRRRNLAYSVYTIIWGIRELRWQDKSNQKAETIKKRQANHVLLTNCMHWSHQTVCLNPGDITGMTIRSQVEDFSKLNSLNMRRSQGGVLSLTKKGK